MNTRKSLLLSIVILLLVSLACNLPFDFDENESEWDEPVPETNLTEPDDEDSAETDNEDIAESDEETSPDDLPPVIEENSGLSRNFSFTLPLFSPDSAWNQRADNASVLPWSDTQILSLYRACCSAIFHHLEGMRKPLPTDLLWTSICTITLSQFS